MSSNHSDESTTFAGVAVVIIVVGALLIKFMTGIFLSLSELFKATGDMAQSFFGMIWWLVLLISLIAAGCAAVYGAFYFVKKFMKLVDEGTEVQRDFQNKMWSVTNLVETSTQKIHREMDQRISKMENELKQALKEPSIAPEVTAMAKPAPDADLLAVIDSVEPPLNNNAPQVMSPF